MLKRDLFGIGQAFCTADFFELFKSVCPHPTPMEMMPQIIPQQQQHRQQQDDRNPDQGLGLGVAALAEHLQYWGITVSHGKSPLHLRVLIGDIVMKNVSKFYACGNMIWPGTALSSAAVNRQCVDCLRDLRGYQVGE